MKVIERVKPLQSELMQHKEQNKSIGFVATMDALHQGHLALIRAARARNDIVVVSIFVNPIQFNNPEDLKKYPRNLTKDLRILEENECDLVFTPSETEIYPEPVREQYDFGHLEQVMEGKYRPGHFNGVAIVVRRLLEIVKPDRTYFGEKDFQQLVIIRKLVEQIGLNVEVISVPIVREEDGLAKSSRNKRLNPEERQVAPVIYRILKEAAQKLNSFKTPVEMKKWGLNKLESHKLIEPEYFEIVDMNSLQEITQWEQTSDCILCVAANLGKVRLIDNIKLFS